MKLTKLPLWPMAAVVLALSLGGCDPSIASLSDEVDDRENGAGSLAAGAIEVTDSAVLVKDEWRHYGPFNASGGTVRAAITGTGDADLYVKMSGRPSLAAYDCRPYASSARESCTAWGTGPVYVSVHAYSAATFRLKVQYAPTPTVSAGQNHTCSLTQAGGVKCWGGNDRGQVGDGTSGTNRLSPVDVLGLNSGVYAVSAGSEHTCALTTAGGVKCWGMNDWGEMGDGTRRTDRLVPVEVVGLQSGVAALSAGKGHTCALTTVGGVKCWGLNVRGEVGDGTTIDRLTPVGVVGLSSGVLAIASGATHSCALTVAGGIKCWGSNERGQLGDGTISGAIDNDRFSPVDVLGLTSGVASVAGGERHTCAITSGGGVKCWGINHTGQVGDGSGYNNRLTPVAVSGLSSGMAIVSAGWSHTCALTAAGGAKCWGYDGQGQLGRGHTGIIEWTPGDVLGLSSGVRSISAGWTHTCAVTNAGSIKCWGDNDFGQVGDGTSGTDRSTPVDVSFGGSGNPDSGIDAGPIPDAGQGSRAPTVTTLAASSISANAASLMATANPNGSSATGWVRFSQTDPGTCNDTFGTRALAEGVSLGAGTAPRTYGIGAYSLTPSTTYYFCAIASNAAGMGFGAVQTFTTTSDQTLDAGPSACGRQTPWHTTLVVAPTQLPHGNGMPGYRSSTAIDSSGGVHVSHVDNYNYKLLYSYRPAGGGAWRTSYVSLSDFQDPNHDVPADPESTSIAVDSRGYIHIMFGAPRGGGIRHAYRLLTSNGAWGIETVDELGFLPSMAVDGSGGLHVAYGRPGMNYHSVAYAYSAPGSLMWAIQLVDSTSLWSSGSHGPPSLKLDAWQGIHIAYGDANRHDVKYAYRSSRGNSGRFGIFTVDAAGVFGMDVSLALDASGGVHVSYSDRSNRTVKYAHRLSSGVFTTESVLVYSPPREQGVGDAQTSLGVDGSGGVHIGYLASSTMLGYLYRPAGGSWRRQEVQFWGPGQCSSGLNPSLVVDANGSVHVSHEGCGLLYSELSCQ